MNLNRVKVFFFRVVYIMNFNVQALDHYYLCGVDGVGFCCVIFAAEILADWLENSSMCVSGIRCGSAWLHGSTVLQLSFEPVVSHLSAWI